MTYLKVPKCLVIRKTPAERDRRVRQRRCLREPSTYLLRRITFVYGGSVVFTDQENTQVLFVYGGSVGKF